MPAQSTGSIALAKTAKRWAAARGCHCARLATWASAAGAAAAASHNAVGNASSVPTVARRWIDAPDLPRTKSVPFKRFSLG